MTNGSQTQWWTADEAPRADVVDPAAPPQAPQRRRRAAGRAAQERERQEARRRRIVVVLVVVALLAGAAYVVASLLKDDESTSQAAVSTAVTDFDGPGHGSVTVTIPAGADGPAIGKALHAAGVVADADVFAREFASSGAPKVAAGAYALPLELSAADAVAALLDPASKASLNLTLAEGLTSWQTLEKISEKTTIPLADLQAAAADAAAIGLPEQAGGKVEGWLAAGAYDVASDATAAQVLSQLVARTVQVLTDKGVAPESWQAVLTKASLVEREMSLDEARPVFARVLENRLRKERTLEIAASVSYGVGSTAEPTAAMLEDASNPYNTYKNVGLPPTPIVSPGAASLDAVLAPADGDWMFWLVVDADSGETKFAVTFDEQMENQAAFDAAQAADG
ncbi:MULTISPECIES: endolytic transglycosylase MltG [Cellulomonas]|uniref:Endolytic murein transglycosylase n=1 Tax=Cellulomonas gelida TaxID=1712 RepID=A0A4Y3KLI6_9CELL|nr:MULTISPECIES: endolytic transglycosylase MltG [Cellulomonas]MCR6703522.1 endolytic transglycosylase MltG [Cellulomonas sp.]GEA84244.1 ABC transporter substrate-binding protein [Cellulomonas gelida]GGL36775.1 ABC transporter substrate-binding protein [Cellulomonas gelida]